MRVVRCYAGGSNVVELSWEMHTYNKGSCFNTIGGSRNSVKRSPSRYLLFPRGAEEG
jgi:hypothetical protein